MFMYFLHSSREFARLGTRIFEGKNHVPRG